MVGVWGADDETVALLIEKIRQLAPDDAAHLWRRIMEYYDASDNKIVLEDFNRVDRERWPHLDEKERIENVFEFSVDRAERLALEQGREQGIEQGREQGIEQGKLDTARDLLLEGVDARIICKATHISKQALAKIKRDLKQN